MSNTLFTAVATRYFRCPRPETYRTLVGEVVTYFTPEHPTGWVEDDMNESECFRLAARYPTLCNEITEAKAREVRARLDAAVTEHERRQASEAALAATTFRATPQESRP